LLNIALSRHPAKVKRAHVCEFNLTLIGETRALLLCLRHAASLGTIGISQKHFPLAKRLPRIIQELSPHKDSISDTFERRKVNVSVLSSSSSSLSSMFNIREGAFH
jgi:hypothetical protein